jgi:hypothetical protein
MLMAQRKYQYDDPTATGMLIQITPQLKSEKLLRPGERRKPGRLESKA